MFWGCDADLSGPIVVEETGVIPTDGLYDTVDEWNIRAKLGDVDLIFRSGHDRTRFIGENGWIARLNDEMTDFAEEPRLLKPSNNDQVGHEGAFLVKINGRYTLLCAGFRSGEDWVASGDPYDCWIATADNVYGPYRKNTKTSPN